jgi:RNA polymerase sigma factor (sigma-70 family)
MVERWDADVRRAARRWVGALGAQADGDDLAQEARIRLVTAARSLGGAPEHYLRRVIANAVLAAAQREGPALETETLLEETPAKEPEAGRADAIDAVARWTTELPTRLKDVYRVLYVEERTQREAAAILGVSQPRVAQLHQTLLSRGRVSLKGVAA